jgi:ribonuclease P protein component
MRLRERRDFDRLRERGQRLVQGCLVANWMGLPTGAVSRLGVITGRKLGGAVVRTRARRLLRTTFRLHQRELERPVEIILVARSPIVGKKLADVERDFMSAMRRANLLKPAA